MENEFVYANLIAAPALILVFLLPGYTLLRVFRISCSNALEAAFYSISLSATVVPILGLALSATVGLTTPSVLLAFLSIASLGLVRLSPRVYAFLAHPRTRFAALIHFSTNLSSPLRLVIVVAIVSTLINWASAMQTHSIDMGVHVYWAKTIMSSSSLPNYATVEPLDQSVKYVLGPHLMLAEYFLLAPIPIETYAWIPSVVGTIGIWAGVALFSHKLTNSPWAAVLASMIYGTSYHPGGYIERGNLPDIVGYLLLIASLYSIIRAQEVPAFRYAFGLSIVSIIPFHQLAVIILPTILVIALAIFSFHSHAELNEILGRLFGGRIAMLFWAGIALVAGVYLEIVSYTNNSALSQLATSGWRPFVVPPLYDLVVPGIGLGILGTGGLIVCVKNRGLGHLILVSWVVGLVVLANALLVGIPIPDPQRFLWRLTEPLSIAAGVLFYRLGEQIRLEQSTIRRYLPNTHTTSGKILSGGLVLVTLLLVAQVPSVIVQTRYHRAERFFQDDARIGQWLAENASSTSVTMNDADIDETATWVQVYSMKLHFIYKLRYATVVAPANYIQIYVDAQTVYDNPKNSSVPQIVERYGLSYVVAHSQEIPLFEASPFFQLVFQSGQSALFETVRS